MKHNPTTRSPFLVTDLDDSVKLSLALASNIAQQLDHYFIDIVHAIGGVIVVSAPEASLGEKPFNAVIECVRSRGLVGGPMIMTGRYPYSPKMVEVGVKLQETSVGEKKTCLSQWMNVLSDVSSLDDWACFLPIGIDKKVLMDWLIDR